jgi:hypothetical protein
MRRRITWRSAAAISMLGLAPGIGAAFAVPAGASTNACLAALGTQCGTFTESSYTTTPGGGASGGLGWDVKGQSSASGTPLIEYPNYSPGTDQGTDLTKVEHYGAIPGSRSAKPGIWYSIVYTPSGKWTSMCVANPDNKGMGGTNLVLRACNQQVWQAFMYVRPTPPTPKAHAQGQPTTPTPAPNVLPEAPTAPSWSTSEVIPNGSSTAPAYALYSVVNGKFVEAAGSHTMSAAAPGPGPGPGPGSKGGGVLFASGRTGDALNSHDNTNTWFWTNANGTPAPTP